MLDDLTVSYKSEINGKLSKLRELYYKYLTRILPSAPKTSPPWIFLNMALNAVRPVRSEASKRTDDRCWMDWTDCQDPSVQSVWPFWTDACEVCLQGTKTFQNGRHAATIDLAFTIVSLQDQLKLCGPRKDLDHNSDHLPVAIIIGLLTKPQQILECR
jgi:hypothetical protein